ncbi:HAD family hydrolase [Salipaludibacillus agaradhaerens]|uniref:HAD family hydrolase n=1 Tax=Salipaludibacillus agaradhaerens TaxID=76935 RepID=A0A9Q4AZC1_SALAG|nr:HAD family hydrolase [Salipaludibacillus agaradhaerens]MCR6095315.1 HAD family hydrolase [Salipaludibacillus agaradhaerens]MCR6115127.1 HAD family hydrolase [Salipaludibacillus agaradhaerens]
MLKAVLFDLDGTLLNRDASLLLFIKKQYKRFNHWVSHLPMEKYITRFIELDKRGYVWKDKVYRQLIDEFAITGLTWEELLQDYISQFHYSCVPFPNLISTLEKLKDYNLVVGMITNGKGQFQLDNIKALGIENYFETIVISEWEGMKKPKPQIFQKTLKNLNVLPSESIYVGDHPENDIQASQNVGMKAVWKRNNQWENVKADFIVEDLKEIPLILDELRK